MSDTTTTRIGSFVGHPTTGLIFYSTLLWNDPTVALRNYPYEFRVLPLETLSGTQREEVSKLTPGEWIRYH